MTDTSKKPFSRHDELNEIRKLLFPELFVVSKDQISGPQSDHDRQAASHLIGELMAGRITPASIAEMERERDELRVELERMTRSRNDLSGVVEEQRRDLRAARSMAETQTGIASRAQRRGTELSRVHSRLREQVAMLNEVLPPENRSGSGPAEVLQDAYDELEARRRELTDLRRRYAELKRQAHLAAYGGESDEILDAISNLEEVVPEDFRTVEGPEGVIEGAIGLIKSLQLQLQRRTPREGIAQLTRLERERDDALTRVGELDHELRRVRQSADERLARLELERVYRHLYEFAPDIRVDGPAEAIGRAVRDRFDSVVESLEVALAKVPRPRDGVDPFVLELDNYRSAMADLYRHVFALPEHVVVPRTNEAARQFVAIRERFDELMAQAKRGGGGAEYTSAEQVLRDAVTEPLTDLLRTFLGPKR